MPDPLIPNDLTEDQLKWGYWFVTHKILLRRILAIILIVFSAATLGFSGYFFVVDYAAAPARDKMLKDMMTTGLNPNVTKSQAPKSLTTGNLQILSPQGKYDFLATVSNPNGNFAAHFTYRFSAAGFATDPEEGFVLPGEQKIVTKLGVASSVRPAGATFEILGVNWLRITAHNYPDWSGFAAGHLTLPITDISYTAAIDLGDGKQPIGRTSFTITNNTGYGYYGLKAHVFMYRGPVIVAANETTFSELRSSQSAAGEVTWFDDYGAVTQIKVVPEIDILDAAAYIKAN